MKSFHAHSVSIQHEDHVLSIGLADDAFDPIDFVILTRQDDPDSASTELLVNETDVEFFDAVTAVRFFDAQIVLELDTALSDSLDYSSIHIELDHDNDQLITAIKRLFQGCNVSITLR